MLYRQIIQTCFESHVGEYGLSDEQFSEFQEQTGPIVDELRANYKSGALPLLRLPEATDDIADLDATATRFRTQFDDVVVLGTGGSSLGGQTLYALADSGFGPRKGGPRLHFLDNVDPDTFELLYEQLELRRTGFIVISKSGGTAETVAQFIACLDRLMMLIGRGSVPEHALVITELENANNPLRSLAHRLSLPVLAHDPNIGGRYSALSLVGLLPAMIAGLDAHAVRRGALNVLKATLEGPDPRESEPAVGAAIKVAFMKKKGIANTVLMPYVDRLANFGLWFQQLWAESLGKNGTGSTPIRAMGTRDQHSQMQLYLDGPRDKLFTLMTLNVAGEGGLISNALVKEPELAYLQRRRMGDLLDAEQRATTETLVRNGCPTRLFELDRLDEEVMGALMMHFMLETIISAGLLGVNAFDQPAVEEGKVLARKFLLEMG
ncbi:glucose-6-phosphate isomerase [Magnetovibrio sp.]|uniref:glucose-6-phosphate isomerase n=1 Tax=Magnetovibrio sp. TaxID=2024836 RepID=UPI002F93356D